MTFELLCCDVPKQEVCGAMGEFPLASVTLWSPGTTCHCHRRRISTTDTRWAVNAEWVRAVHSLFIHIYLLSRSICVRDALRNKTQCKEGHVSSHLVQNFLSISLQNNGKFVVIFFLPIFPTIKVTLFITQAMLTSGVRNEPKTLFSSDQHLLHSAVCIHRRKRVLVDWLAVGQQSKWGAGSAVCLHPPLWHYLQLVPGWTSTWERLPGHDWPLTCDPDIHFTAFPSRKFKHFLLLLFNFRHAK